MSDPQARRSLPLAPRAEPGLRHLPLAPEARDVDRKFRPDLRGLGDHAEVRSRLPPLRLARGPRRGPTSCRPRSASTWSARWPSSACREVTLIGGEAYLRDDWLEIVRAHPRARACSAR